MALYDWPAPPSQDEDRLALRNSHYARLWRSVAAGYAEGAAAQVNAELASVANSGITDAQVDARRWLPIGPSAIVGGQAGGAPEVAGRVRDIRRSPDGARIYLATAGGGVWFSGDAGRSWAPLGFMATTPATNAATRVPISPVIGCLHVEFGANADADTIYAGTGEPSHDVNDVGLPATAGGGIGVLKLAVTVGSALADPNGAHWQREAPNLSGAGIYRIVRSPTDPDTLVAATTFGLYLRSGAFAPNAAWTRAGVAPFAGAIEDRLVTTDAVWVPAATAPSAAPARLFVALVNLGKKAVESALYVSEAGLAGPFTQVSLAGYAKKNRIALAAVMPAANAPGTHPQAVYVLSNGDGGPRLWRVDGKDGVNGVAKAPPTLFGGKRDVDGESVHTTEQSWHNMAVAVGPADPAIVYLGGGAEMGILGWSASLYRCTISGSAAAGNFKTDFLLDNTPREDPTFIGENVPANVHSLRLSDDGQTLWVGGDGGAFVTATGGTSGSIEPRNDGLATAECGYVVSHPGHAGAVIAIAHGTGVLQRIGDTVWRREPWGGDAGGLAYHPQAGRESFFAAQRTRTIWHADGRFDAPVARAAFSMTRIAPENNRALIYSSPAVAVGAAAGKARLAIGTYRVWITDDWDPLAPTSAMAWRTLPSATDPLAGEGPNFKVDCIDDSAGSVIAIRWLDSGTPSGSSFVGGKLIALYEKAVVRLQQDGAGKWTRDVLAWSKKSRLNENSDIPANGAPSDKLPMFAAWTAIAPHRPTKPGDTAFKGSFYITMSGHSARTASGITESDRLDTLWWFDGKGNFYPTGFRANASKAPALAVVCDPENPDTVYVGGAAGVWRGAINTAGAAPAWTFEPFGFGLPEAPVHDLSVHWDASAPNGGVKLLRAAARARGVWEVDVSANPASVGRAYLRVHDVDTRRVLPTRLVNLSSEAASPPAYPRCLSPDIAVVNKVPATWSNGVPTEADLAMLPDTLMTVGKPGARFRAQQVIADAHKAFVLAHYRHVKPATANDIKIVLLKRRLTEAEGDGAGIVLSTVWKDAVAKLLVSNQGATLDDHWKRADALETSDPATNAVTVANTVRAIAGPIDARTPRPAVFNLNLAAATLKQHYLLLAVMTSANDPLTRAELEQPTVGDLMLNSPHVCARTLVVASASALFQHVLLDHFDSASGSVVVGTVPATPTTQVSPFYDATLPRTRSDLSLQGKLDKLLNEERFRKLKKKIGVSLIDLTGANKFAPKYAGFNDRTNFYAASTGKISALLAAYQLKADATDVLAHNPAIDSLDKLAAALSSAWTLAGQPERHHPLVKKVLTFTTGSTEPIGLQPELLACFADISHGNANGSTAIILMRFPYIGSTLLAHGLFSPVDKTGLWCRASYGGITYMGKKMTIAPWASKENPFPDVPSNSVSAVAAGQYLTLAAQGRLIDRKTSTAILGHLSTGGCYITDFMVARPNSSAKCGIYGGFNNEVVYFREPGGREMVVIVLSKDVSVATMETLTAAITALV